MIAIRAGLAVCGMLWLTGMVKGAAPQDATTQARDRVYSVTGRVVSPLREGMVRIAHEEVPGFMPAMTMPFYVADEDEAGRLRAGDHVQFQFTVGERSSASAFEVLSREGMAGENTAPASASLPAARTAQRLKPGSLVPSVAFTTQDGNPLPEQYFVEGYIVLTFIFTRCPVPEFCPRMMARFKEIEAALPADPGAASRVRLLVITIDPEHDTPAVLKKYGESFGVDFDRWTFVTGEPETLRMLEKAFVVRVAQNKGTLDHTLATALVAPGGRIVEIFRGNAWKSDEVLAALRSDEK